jgi:signal transduction histidine kinase
MNDDMQQIHEETFDRIIYGLGLLGMVGTVAAFALDGFSSPWFLRALALLIVTLIAYLLRRAGQFVVATYVLVLELVGVVAGIFLQTGATANFVPFLFIPIIIIAGILLSPPATLIIAVVSIGAALTILAVTGEFSAASLGLLLPSFGLTLLAGLLATEIGHYIKGLGSRLTEGRQVLQERTVNMLEALDRAELLQQRLTRLEQEQSKGQVATSQREQAGSQTDNRLYDLIKGTIHELDVSVRELKTTVEKIETHPALNIYRGMFETAWAKIDYLDNMVINLEEMVQLEGNKVSLNYQAIDVGRLIAEVVETARGVAREKDVQIRYRVAENIPPIQADPTRVRQALFHLLNNAVKYTDEGLIEVQAELNDTELIIYVSDTGIGMYREEMDVIFERFGRGRGTIAQQRQGPGLGLAISQRLVQMHGGRMWVSSVLGVGSTFYMTLPLVPKQKMGQATVPLAVMPAPDEPDAPTRVSGPVTPLPYLEPVAYAMPAAEDDEGTIVSYALDTKSFDARPPAGSDPFANDLDTRLTFPTMGEPQAESVQKQKLGSPVARFGPTYISRFGLTLLALLLIIALIVGGLAILNGPSSRSGAATEAASSPSNAVVETPTTARAAVAASPTLPPTTTPFPTPTLPPTLSATLDVAPTVAELPAASPTPLPTDTPAVVVEPVTATAIPTEPVPSPSPSPAASPTPTQSLVDTADTSNEPEPTPSPTTVIQPVALPGEQLAFTVGSSRNQSIALRSLDNGSYIDLTGRVGTVNDSGQSWSRNGQLLFSLEEEYGDREIYTVNTANGVPYPLTHAPGDDIEPAWSPDDSKIAFSSGRNGHFDIYVMNADGSNPTRLTTSRGYDEWPAWSPDSRRIAFVSDRDSNVEIYTMDAEGGNERRLTNHPADDWPVTWSSDGRRLVFSSNRDSNWNLYLIDADGGNLRRLTNDPGNERNPTWSPDGRTIAFTYDGNGNQDVYTIRAPGGAFIEIPRPAWTQVTDTPVDEQKPVWLP